MGVYESGQHSPALGIDDGIRGGRLPRRAGPGHRPVLDDQRRVRNRREAIWVVGNQFADLRDQRAARDCHRTSLPHPHGAAAQGVEAAEGAFKRVGEPLAVTGGQQVEDQAGERRLDQRRLAFGVLGLDAVRDQAVGDVLAPERDLLRPHVTGQTADRGVQRGGFETQSHQGQVLRAAVDPPPPAALQVRRGQVRYLPPPRRFDAALNLSGPPQGGDHQLVLAAEVMDQRVDRHTQFTGHWPQGHAGDAVPAEVADHLVQQLGPPFGIGMASHQCCLIWVVSFGSSHQCRPIRRACAGPLGRAPVRGAVSPDGAGR